MLNEIPGDQSYCTKQAHSLDYKEILTLSKSWLVGVYIRLIGGNVARFFLGGQVKQREKKISITTRMAERSKYWPCHLNVLNSSLALTTSWICLSVVQIHILGYAYKLPTGLLPVLLLNYLDIQLMATPVDTA